MDFLSSTGISSIVYFLLGCLSGILFYKVVLGSNMRNNILKKQLDETNKKLNDYKKCVNEHMAASAQLFKNLSASNHAIKQHFMQSFQELCDDKDLYCQLTKAIDQNITTVTEDYSSSKPVYKEPKDYVPKDSPSTTGVLSEGFGLKKHNQTEKKPIDEI